MKRSVTRVALELGLLALVVGEEVEGRWEVGVDGVMIRRGVDGLVAARRASMSTIWWIGVVGVVLDIVIVVGGWVWWIGG